MSWLVGAVVCGMLAYSFLRAALVGVFGAIALMLGIGMCIGTLYCLGRWWAQPPPQVVGTNQARRAQKKPGPFPVLVYRSNALAEVVLALLVTSATYWLWSLGSNIVLLFAFHTLLTWISAVRALGWPAVRLEADTIVIRSGLLGGGGRVPYTEVRRVEHHGNYLALHGTRPPPYTIPLNDVRSAQRSELISELLRRCGMKETRESDTATARHR